jgi:hypothetical protein
MSRRSPDIVFLLETHVELFPAEMLRRQLRMDFKEVVVSDGRSGGLIIFWKKEVVLSVRDKTENFIDVFIGAGQDNIWRFTGMYGEPRWENKHLTWQRLRYLSLISDMPWLVMGDLNDILYQFEKEGGRTRAVNCMQAFRDAIDDCNLTDMGYIGDKFTWQRGNIRERLDRALANEAWSDKFPDACLHHLDYYRSDHRPILMYFEEPVVEENRGPPVLRFEARWLKEKNFMDIVQGAWNLSDPLDMDLPLAGKLAKVHDQLHRWDMSVLKRNKNTLRKTQRELENVVRQSMSPENLARQKELADEIEKLLEMEEIHWAQRSRVDWLKYGDHNTNYFHNAASTRRKKNRIMKLIDDNGNHIEGTTYLNPLVSDYFVGLFTTEVDESDPVLLSRMIPKVTEQINNGLVAD